MGKLKRGETPILAADFRTKLLPELIWNLEEGFNDGRVELSARTAQDFLARRVEAAGFAIRPVAGNGIKGVGDREDAGADGNLRPG